MAENVNYYKLDTATTEYKWFIGLMQFESMSLKPWFNNSKGLGK